MLRSIQPSKSWSRDHEIRWLASHLVRIKKWTRAQAIERVLQLSRSQRLELRRKVYKTVCEMSRASRPRPVAACGATSLNKEGM